MLSRCSALHHDGKRDGGNHKDNSSPDCCLGEYVGSRPRAECSLRTLAAKGACQICAAALLEQDHDDQEEGDNDVNGNDKINHEMAFGGDSGHTAAAQLWGFREKIIWCGRGDLNPHASRRHPLKMVCLPISPLPHLGELCSLRSITNRNRQENVGFIRG